MNALAQHDRAAQRSLLSMLKLASLLATGAALHLVIILLPAWLAGSLATLLANPTCWGLIVCAELLLLVEASSIWYAAEPTRAGLDSANAWYRASAIVTGTTLLLMTWLALAATNDRSAWIVSLAFGSMLGGIVLRGAAVHWLRERFVTSARTDADGPIIESGIYRFVRHPSEVGLLLFAGGLAVIGGGWLLPTIWLAIQLPMSIIRMQLEDRHMLATHGEVFRAYRTRVGGVVPRH